MKKTKQTQNLTEWLTSLSSTATRVSHRSATRLFLQSVYQTEQEPEALADRYLKELAAGRDHIDDLSGLIASMKDVAHNP
jgi:hypothetical protein